MGAEKLSPQQVRDLSELPAGHVGLEQETYEADDEGRVGEVGKVYDMEAVRKTRQEAAARAQQAGEAFRSRSNEARAHAGEALTPADHAALQTLDATSLALERQALSDIDSSWQKLQAAREQRAKFGGEGWKGNIISNLTGKLKAERIIAQDELEAAEKEYADTLQKYRGGDVGQKAVGVHEKRLQYAQTKKQAEQPVGIKRLFTREKGPRASQQELAEVRDQYHEQAAELIADNAEVMMREQIALCDAQAVAERAGFTELYKLYKQVADSTLYGFTDNADPQSFVGKLAKRGVTVRMGTNLLLFAGGAAMAGVPGIVATSLLRRGIGTVAAGFGTADGLRTGQEYLRNRGIRKKVEVLGGNKGKEVIDYDASSLSDEELDTASRAIASGAIMKGVRLGYDTTAPERTKHGTLDPMARTYEAIQQERGRRREQRVGTEQIEKTVQERLAEAHRQEDAKMESTIANDRQRQATYEKLGVIVGGIVALPAMSEILGMGSVAQAQEAKGGGFRVRDLKAERNGAAPPPPSEQPSSSDAARPAQPERPAERPPVRPDSVRERPRGASPALAETTPVRAVFDQAAATAKNIELIQKIEQYKVPVHSDGVDFRMIGGNLHATVPGKDAVEGGFYNLGTAEKPNMNGWAALQEKMKAVAETHSEPAAPVVSDVRAPLSPEPAQMPGAGEPGDVDAAEPVVPVREASSPAPSERPASDTPKPRAEDRPASDKPTPPKERPATPRPPKEPVRPPEPVRFEGDLPLGEFSYEQRIARATGLFVEESEEHIKENTPGIQGFGERVQKGLGRVGRAVKRGWKVSNEVFQPKRGNTMFDRETWEDVGKQTAGYNKEDLLRLEHEKGEYTFAQQMLEAQRNAIPKPPSPQEVLDGNLLGQAQEELADGKLPIKGGGEITFEEAKNGKFKIEVSKLVPRKEAVGRLFNVKEYKGIIARNMDLSVPAAEAQGRVIPFHSDSALNDNPVFKPAETYAQELATLLEARKYLVAHGIDDGRLQAVNAALEDTKDKLIRYHGHVLADDPEYGRPSGFQKVDRGLKPGTRNPYNRHVNPRSNPKRYKYD